ncbi:MAG: DEAD/DEAH box helicase [Parcubacteria group bacterium]|nr:DEAD/DEAH box helicase [Parcubacteria group bacterium]
MSRVEAQSSSILIPGLTPELLDKPASWFDEQREKIETAVRATSWWASHVLILEEGQGMSRSALMRKLDQLGYVKVSGRPRPGQFAVRGGVIDCIPIHALAGVRIEFFGDAIERILPLPAPETELPHEKELERTAEAMHPEALQRLNPGEFIVHEDHGVGIFRGMVRHDTSSFFLVEYAAPRTGAQPDRLLVPIGHAKKLSRYLGFTTPHVHRLGGSLWIRTKRKVREEIYAFARQLLALYAEREIVEREHTAIDMALQRALEDSFGFTETRDQRASIDAILTDLTETRPMDRLICGDVGFGKTEVAVRTSAAVAGAGMQVALLAPTTILAEQHYETFRDRFRQLPIRIALLTRFQLRRKEHEILRDLERGVIDIVIGTHRILSRDIRFQNLGLLIIDEEQRFGVRQKERLRESRAHLDVLSLSATPIPRTLYGALSQLRDMSIIQTPPPGRTPIRTYVLPRSGTLIREAIGAELNRGGQVFYLCNRIHAMEYVERELRALLAQRSDVRIALLHGRLSEERIRKTMRAFRAGEYTVLIATTIIENGLDLPNVNTLIVADATRLGLAESHQLRGRIGRGTSQAYAYFLYPGKKLDGKASLRLQALESASHLGAGYDLALSDLEIRGAGNILGREQSGSINQIGLNLYCHMLAEAVEELRHNRDRVRTPYYHERHP